MTIDCPHGYRSRGRIGNVTLEWRTVSVYGGVCDHADRCKVINCRYYDLTRTGNLLFFAAINDGETIEGMLARRAEPQLDLDRDHPRNVELLQHALARHRARTEPGTEKPN